MAVLVGGISWPFSGGRDGLDEGVRKGGCPGGEVSIKESVCPGEGDCQARSRPEDDGEVFL